MEEVERIEEEMCEEERWRSLYQVRFSQTWHGTLGFKRTRHEIDSEYFDNNKYGSLGLNKNLFGLEKGKDD
jgi:hypothetical protein